MRTSTRTVAPRRLALALALAALAAPLLAHGAPARAAETLERPEFSVFPSSLDFGGSAVGAARTLAATFENRGQTTLTVEAAQAPGGPFEARGLPAAGARLPSGDVVVEVVFKPTATGSYSGSLGLTVGGEQFTVGLSGTGTPSPAETPQPPSPPAIAPPASAISPQPAGVPPPGLERPPTLRGLHARTRVSASARRARTLAVAYTLSAPGRVALALARRTVAHRCPRRARSCVSWSATRVRLTVSARAGRNSRALSLAGLAAGEYRLRATPLARSGAAGRAQALTFALP